MAGEQQTIDKFVEIYTKEYKGPQYSNGLYSTFLNPQRPIFWRIYVPAMLRDPHLWYGMELLKGPITSKAKFTVECEDSEVQEYIDRQIKNFWKRGVDTALDALAWGYSGSEVIYKFNRIKGYMEFHNLRFIHQRDVKAVTKDGEMVAMEVDHVGQNGSSNRIYLLKPKFFWMVNDQKVNRWYGRSRLEGAFDSWWETWMPKGYRGIRRMWFYRHAFEGGVLYYPDGSTVDPDTGEHINNALIAQELIDRKETGSSLALPNKTGDNRDWEWEAPSGNKAPEGLFEYGDSLRDEMWAGIGVPPEVAKQENTGSFAGRRVPQQAFYSNLQEVTNQVFFAFQEQILDNLIELTFGPDIDYDVTPISILQTLQEEEMGGMGANQFGSPEQDEEDVEVGEDGEPLENNPTDMGDGRVEDRDSNAFNLKEKSLAKRK